MKTFDIASNAPFPPPFKDEDHCCQDEAAWANRLFNNWFEERGLGWGSHYHIEKDQDGNVLVCFKGADEALWFKMNSEFAA